MSAPENYYNIYLKRLNRYGEDYQTRIQSKREQEFELYLLKSVYRIDFDYEDKKHPATFEKYKQDETETLHYLLTKIDLNIPNGTVLMLPNKDDELKPWMVYYLETIKASGYNRYIMLKMTHHLFWKDRENIERDSWAYMYGPQNGALRDTVVSTGDLSRFFENSKLNYFIMPKNQYIKRDIYFEVGEDEFKEGYRVTGYDIQSTEGVEYVSVDPIYLFDNTPAPEKTENDSDEEFFWLTGGN